VANSPREVSGSGGGQKMTRDNERFAPSFGGIGGEFQGSSSSVFCSYGSDMTSFCSMSGQEAPGWIVAGGDSGGAKARVEVGNSVHEGRRMFWSHLVRD
jgi:hypothetical protein